MTDVGTWDPVDDNNNAASPNGWPEGMMPSGVNNSARMMMGAVRREHDRIVTQIGSTEGAITSGGTLTVPNIVYSGQAGHTFAFGWDGAATHVYVDGSDVGTIGDINSVAAGNGLTGGGTTGALTLALSGSYSGDFTASGTITANGNITSSGTITANGNIVTAGYVQTFHIYDASGLQAIAMNNDIVFEGNNHWFRNKADISTYALFSSGGCYNVNGSWGTLSDPSLKEDIAPYSRGLDAVRRLKPVTFRYRAGTPFASKASSAPLIGLMADEVMPVIPEIVGETSIELDGGAERAVATLSPGSLVYSLINAVRELSTLVDSQAARIAALETALVK